MDKGQHLRLFITDISTDKVIAMATELSLQGTAQTENSTTKDTTDATGSVWDEFDTVSRSAVINFSALIFAYYASERGLQLNGILSRVNDTLFGWKIAVASGEQNRTMGTVIASGQGKMVNVQATGQVGQQATYSGSINVWGPMETIHVVSTNFNVPVPVATITGGPSYQITLNKGIDAEEFIQLVKIGYANGSYDETTGFAELTQESGTISVKLNGSKWCEIVATDSNLKTWIIGNIVQSFDPASLVITDIFI